MISLFDRVLHQVLSRFPYFEKESNALGYALDLLTGRESTNGADGPAGAINLIEATVFFYGTHSSYLVIEGASEGIRKLPGASAYDNKVIIPPDGSFLYRLEISKNPMLGLVARSQQLVELRQTVEFVSGTPTEFKTVPSLNQTLHDVADFLLSRHGLSQLIVAASPLGVLDLNVPVPTEQLFITPRHGMLVGYAVFFLKVPEGGAPSLVGRASISEINNALQVLWIICSGRDRYKLFKYERMGREEFMSDILHRVRAQTVPADRALRKIRKLIEQGQERASIDYVRRNVPLLLTEERNYIARLEEFVGLEDPQSIDIDAVCLKAVSELQANYPYAAKFFLEGSTGRTVVGLKSEVGFSIDELLYNAHKYADPEHQIHIGLTTASDPEVDRRLRERVHEDDFEQVKAKLVRITIVNHGGGIPEAEKENIFKRKYTLRKAQDGGMGLYLVRKYIEEHHGGLVYEDGVPDEFTRIQVVLIAD